MHSAGVRRFGETQLLIDSHHRAIGHCGCGAQAARLPSKATFSEEIALVQNADCGFLPALRHNGELHFSCLYIKNSIGRVALNKDRLLFGKGYDFPTAVEGRKECLGIEFDAFLGRRTGAHLVFPIVVISHANCDGLFCILHTWKRFVRGKRLISGPRLK